MKTVEIFNKQTMSSRDIANIAGKMQDAESPCTYHFTDGEMLEILLQLHSRPINKGMINKLLKKGKKGPEL